MIKLSFDNKDYNRLKVLAHKSGLSVSALIRILIRNLTDKGLVIDVKTKI